MPIGTSMGPPFHASQLAGAVSQQIPTVSYAFATNNQDLFGVDATYSASGIVSLYTTITPVLLPPTSGVSIYCTPFAANSPQSIKCNALDHGLGPGQYTLSFEQCPSTANQQCQTTYLDGAVTFSVVPAPVATVTPTGTTISVTLTSGTTDTTTTTTIYPASVHTVTSYETTIVSVQTSTTSLTAPLAPVTVTGPCPVPTTTTTTTPATVTTAKPLVCNHDNCLRALLGKTSSASAFCATYTAAGGLQSAPSAFATSCSSSASRLSSACSCLAAPSSSSSMAPARKFIRGMSGAYADLDAALVVEARGLADAAAEAHREKEAAAGLEGRGAMVLYGGPDFTFAPGQYVAGTVVAAGAGTATVTVGTVPATTTTDPGAIVTSGTSTSTLDLPTTTVTVVISTVDTRAASTVTVAPTACMSTL